jgi:hypothetical protein
MRQYSHFTNRTQSSDFGTVTDTWFFKAQQSKLLKGTKRRDATRTAYDLCR